MNAANHIAVGSPAETHVDHESPVIDIQRLVVSYSRRRQVLKVLDEVSLCIRRREVYGLAGESGCGKSTLAMAIVRYLPANAVIGEGRIVFRGHDDLLTASKAQLRALRGRHIAMVYQDPRSALNPSITIGRQLAEVYRHHRTMSAKESASASRDMLQAVQLPDPGKFMRRYPHQLSGGQQQRVVLAMALATNPELLIMDEPTTGLDATVEAEVLDLVVQLRAEFNAAILFISHNLGVLARTCDKVGVMYAGQLVEEAPADELFASPKHPYTAALLRCVPQLDAGGNKGSLYMIPGSLPALGSISPGCPYASRCPIAGPKCWVNKPPIVDVDGARRVRCFFHERTATISPNPGVAQATGSPTEGLQEISGSPVLLDVRDVVKTYQSRQSTVKAVDHVSIQIHRGETLAIVGESGSGKSSLAKCIAGVCNVSSGSIYMGGVKLAGTASVRSREQRRELQLVFQNPDTSLNPRHTVRHILRRAITLLSPGLSHAETSQRVYSLAAMARLESRYLNMRPSDLSGGLKQRVAIARAFAGSPSIVICDEPTSALDVSVQAGILNLLANLQANENVSYIFISHDLGVVRHLADRVAVMYLGRIVEIGPVASIFSTPNHPYTKTLIAAAPRISSVS